MWDLFSNRLEPSRRRRVFFGFCLIACLCLLAGCSDSDFDLDLSQADHDHPSTSSPGGEGDSGSGDSDSDWGTPGGPTSPVATLDQRVEPGSTGSGITRTMEVRNQHLAAVAADTAERRDKLVVFLGGSASEPADYVDFTRFAASYGFATLNLRYPNDTLPGQACILDDDCFTALRGESLFGANLAYRPGAAVFDSAEIEVDAANSIVNRLVQAIDHLALNGGIDGNSADYWSQFLVYDESSPYVASEGNAYPDWSNIVLAGHSQGGATAAFFTVQTFTEKPDRVLMFSAPNDSVRGESANWIATAPLGVADRFWGMRHIDEGVFGEMVPTNWDRLFDTTESIDVGDGSEDPRGHRRLVLSMPNRRAGFNHNTTVADFFHPDTIDRAWRHLLIGEP